jgi:hypothetical protein
LAKYHKYKRECREAREAKAAEALKSQMKKDAANQMLGTGLKALAGLRKNKPKPIEKVKEQEKLTSSGKKLIEYDSDGEVK